MRYLLTLFIIGINLSNIYAQKTVIRSQILKPEQITEIFTDTICKTLSLNFPIFRVYKYTDKTAQYYCILTESRDQITVEPDTLNYKLKALNVKIDKNTLTKTWEINDAILKDRREESSIWFWTRYIEFTDFDNDGIADPVIVYGTSAMNGYGDGRIKFIIYYRGQKVAIRHQNGILDFERETQVDQAFYEMPQSLQAVIKQKMELMIKNNQAIFPAGWQAAMKNKKTTFNER